MVLRSLAWSQYEDSFCSACYPCAVVLRTTACRLVPSNLLAPPLVFNTRQYHGHGMSYIKLTVVSKLPARSVVFITFVKHESNRILLVVASNLPSHCLSSVYCSPMVMSHWVVALNLPLHCSVQKSSHGPGTSTIMPVACIKPPYPLCRKVTVQVALRWVVASNLPPLFLW